MSAGLIPAECIALTMARAILERGDNPGPNITGALVLTLDRLLGARPARPPIVCLCGSTRFGNFFREANLRLTLAGEIVLSIGCDTKSDGDLTAAGALGYDAQQAKADLDELHRHKIDLADYVLVVSDETGYFGDSTWGEITYARSLGKPVKFAVAAAGDRARQFAESAVRNSGST